MEVVILVRGFGTRIRDVAEYFSCHGEVDWRITLADTGLNAMTAPASAAYGNTSAGRDHAHQQR